MELKQLLKLLECAEHGYSHLSSREAKDFLEKFRNVVPFEIKGVKTDNGSEFLEEFEAYLKREG